MQCALYTGSVLRTSGHGNIQYIHPDEQKRLLTVMECSTDNTVGAHDSGNWWTSAQMKSYISEINLSQGGGTPMQCG